jgi:hypothetical protein
MHDLLGYGLGMEMLAVGRRRPAHGQLAPEDTELVRDSRAGGNTKPAKSMLPDKQRWRSSRLAR